MEEVHHKTVASWFEQLETSRGHDLVCCDDPLRRNIGFIDHTDEKHHLVNLIVIKETDQEHREVFRSVEDRVAFVASFH